MDKLIELLNDLYPNIDFTKEKELITGGLLDSSDTVELISEIEDAFDISVTMKYIKPETFESAEAMWQMITELQG